MDQSKKEYTKPIMTDQPKTPYHVLIIDDECRLTESLKRILQTRGFKVHVAHNGRQAFESIGPHIDLILLDLMLPDMDGFDVCRQIKQQPDTAHIPIIMISAYSLVEDRVEGLYIGADDFLTKPFDNNELIARMDAVLRRRAHKLSSGVSPDHEIFEELRRILNHAKVTPYYQPIYRLDPFQLYGMEILTRPSSDTDLAHPEVFFKKALQFGLYTELETLSWTLALKHLGELLRDEKVFLNCNPYFIQSAKFCEIEAIFEKSRIPSQQVVLEITERSAITDFKFFYKQLKRLREFGFCFAVDDVGGGYASLESIVETQPELVKIDRHIVEGVAHDGFKQSVVEFVVSFCRHNNILSIAEGIETPEDLDTVKRLGVDAAQGFYLCRPTPELDLEAYRLKPDRILQQTISSAKTTNHQNA